MIGGKEMEHFHVRQHLSAQQPAESTPESSTNQQENGRIEITDICLKFGAVLVAPGESWLSPLDLA